MKKESYEKLEMEVIADREDADEGIWTGYY